MNKDAEENPFASLDRQQQNEDAIPLDPHSHGDAIMEFYIEKVFSIKAPTLKAEMVAANPLMDGDLVMAYVDSHLEKYKKEVARKLNSIGLLLVDFIIQGRLDELRDFESRFIDLVERTLLRSVNMNQVLKVLAEKIQDRD